MFYEILVIDYITDFKSLTADEITYLSSNGLLNPQFLINCPNGTIIGIPIDGNSNNQKKIFYPMLSHISMPIKAGERAWAFNQKSYQVSYWVSKKVQNISAEDLNFTHDDRSRSYPFIATDKDGALKNSQVFFDSSMSVLPLNSVRSDSLSRIKEFIGEPVAPVKSKSPDLTLQGSNGTLINLSNNSTKKSATIDIVAGLAETDKKEKVENSLKYEEVVKPTKSISSSVNDSSRLIISQKFNADRYYELPDDNAGDIPTIAIKTDSVRIIPRKDLKIIVGSDDTQSKIFIKNDGNIILQQGSGADCKIKLTGDEANQPYVLHDELVDALTEIKSSILNLKTSIQSIAGLVDPLITAATGATLAATTSITATNTAIDTSVTNIENAISRIGSTRIVGS